GSARGVPATAHRAARDRPGGRGRARRHGAGPQVPRRGGAERLVVAPPRPDPRQAARARRAARARGTAGRAARRAGAPPVRGVRGAPSVSGRRAGRARGLGPARPAAPSATPVYTCPVSSLRRLLPYLDRYRLRYLGGAACLLLATAFSLSIPWAVKSAVDALERDGAAARLGPYVALILVLAVAHGMARLGSRFAILGAGQWVEHDIRADVYSRLLALPTAFYHAH